VNLGGRTSHEFQRTRYGYALKIDSGEEIFSHPAKAFAEAQVSGRSDLRPRAVGETELGFFCRDAHLRAPRLLGDHEIGSLTGNFSELDGSHSRTAIW